MNNKYTYRYFIDFELANIDYAVLSVTRLVTINENERLMLCVFREFSDP
jgi:hypothetical protein